MAAIWKDVFVNLGTSASRTFTIATGGVTIYTGKGYKKPDASNILVRINDICADYLSQNLPTLTDATDTTHAALARTFTITPTDGTAVTQAFSLDWSYDNAAPAANLSQPVRLHAAAGQPVFDTTLGATNKTKCHIKQSGTIALSGSRSVSVDLCDEYSLLYVNAFGGWDSIAVTGRSVKTDTYGRHTARHTYDNAQATGRAATNYANDITRTWELHTGWLTDDEAGRMHHLLGSTLVFLYNNTTAAIYPVVISNGDCPYKTYNTNHSLVDYTLNIELARDMQRR